MSLVARLSDALPRFLRILRKMGLGLMGFGALFFGLGVGMADELSDPTRWQVQGVGMVLLGALAWAAARSLSRGSIWAAPLLVALGVVASVAALAMPLPELTEQSEDLALALRIALIATWWLLSGTALVISRKGGKTA